MSFDLGALDIDPAFRETVFAHFREKFGGRMSSSTSTATPSGTMFESRVAEVKTPKSDINALVLDYLTTEGYHKAAARFCKEANLQPQQENSSIRARQEVQNFIHNGQIVEAISALNEVDPEILDEDPELHFALLRLQLVELIRACKGGDITAALEFATGKLAPRAAGNSAFLKDLEQTMALLIFPHDDNLKPELAALLRSDLRRRTATQVNQAILTRQTGRREASIRNLVRMRAWAEDLARSNKKNLPERMDLGLNGDDDDLMHENGHEAMITT